MHPPTVAARIIRCFAEHYCSADMIERTGRSLRDLDVTGHLEQFIQQSRIASTDARSAELLVRIAALEGTVVTLQRVCDERQEVIVGVDKRGWLDFLWIKLARTVQTRRLFG